MIKNILKKEVVTTVAKNWKRYIPWGIIALETAALLFLAGSKSSVNVTENITIHMDTED